MVANACWRVAAKFAAKQKNREMMRQPWIWYVVRLVRIQYGPLDSTLRSSVFDLLIVMKKGLWQCSSSRAELMDHEVRMEIRMDAMSRQPDSIAHH